MDSMPQYWGLLSDADKAQYNTLRIAFTPGSILQTRNSSPESFEDMLNTIRKFAERGDENDWRRFLVCGICWVDNAVAVNTRQLRLLVSKCKSSINGSLQKMGYTTNTSHAESWKIIFLRIPLLKDNFNELRQWTIRYKANTDGTPNKAITTPTVSARQTYEIPKLQKIQPPLPMVQIHTMPFPEIHLPQTTQRVESEVVKPLKFRSYFIGNDK